MARVVEIIVPERVEAMAAALRGAHQPRVLRFVLADEHDVAAMRRLPRRPHDGGDHVLVRGVEDGLRRVKAQAVEVELVDPIGGVGDEELADAGAFGPSKLMASPHSFS